VDRLISGRVLFQEAEPNFDFQLKAQRNTWLPKRSRDRAGRCRPKVLGPWASATVTGNVA
jgi:hypothetical protein